MTKIIEKTTTATIVYRKLRQDILMGAFEPGQKLAIDVVAERYAVGTNPVREALNRLSAERLVDRHEQRGFFVPSISIEKWRELVKTRCWLETKALEEIDPEPFHRLGGKHRPGILSPVSRSGCQGRSRGQPSG